MKKTTLMVLIIVLSNAGCNQDKEEILFDIASEMQNLEKLTQQQIRKDCKTEVNDLKKLGFTRKTPEVMKKPEYTRFMKCAGKADKKFLAGILKKEKPITKKGKMTYSIALGMLNKAIFNDIENLCKKEEKGFERNMCNFKEIEKVRNSLGVD